MSEWDTIWSAIQTAASRPTVIGLLALIGFGFWREWIVPGSRHRRMVRRCDELERRLDLAMDMLAQAVGTNAARRKIWQEGDSREFPR